MNTAVRHYAKLDSTNTEALKLAAAGAPEGVCVVADEQTRGRGRLGRAWASPPGAGLYMSLILRPRRLPPASWSLLTLAAAVAVVAALDKFGFEDETDIKWPNDIHDRGGRKLGGILAETVETPSGRAAVLGIGINLSDEALPAELREAATSLAALTGRRLDAETVLEGVLGEWEIYYPRLEAPGGGRDILRLWAAHSSYAEGREVRVTSVGETIEGVTRGLEADGALRVETAGGEIKIIRAGDVTALRRRPV